MSGWPCRRTESWHVTKSLQQSSRHKSNGQNHPQAMNLNITGRPWERTFGSVALATLGRTLLLLLLKTEIDRFAIRE